MAEIKEEEEHVYTIPIKIGRGILRHGRARKAIKSIKEYVARHINVKEDDVWIDAHVNKMIWKRGAQKVPSSIRVKVKLIKFDDGTEIIEVLLPEK